MKVYEYLSAGLPVVGTPLPSLDGSRSPRPPPPEMMLERLEEALREDPEERAEKRSRRAALHSWDSRMEEIAVAIERLDE